MMGYPGAASNSITSSPKEIFFIWSWSIRGMDNSMFEKGLWLVRAGEEKTFFQARCDGSNQLEFSLLEDNV